MPRPETSREITLAAELDELKAEKAQAAERAWVEGRIEEACKPLDDRIRSLEVAAPGDTPAPGEAIPWQARLAFTMMNKVSGPVALLLVVLLAFLYAKGKGWI